MSNSDDTHRLRIGMLVPAKNGNSILKSLQPILCSNDRSAYLGLLLLQSSPILYRVSKLAGSFSA